jgi:hypothetical protein
MMTDQAPKRGYSAPRLVEFGSVRNLTGGSGSSNMQDVAAGMVVVMAM